MSAFRSCERIMVPLCKDMPYNLTRLPNLMGDTDQNSVAQSLLDFEPLVNIKCSKNLRFFLCSVFTPMCTEAMDEPITSCRSVCQEVERSCAPLLSNFGLAWPALLNCSQFPAQNSEPPCMDPSPSKQKEDTLRKEHDTLRGNKIETTWHHKMFINRNFTFNGFAKSKLNFSLKPVNSI
ncbi:frizzled-4 [Trichinella spiralis]|uniref:frizzled-4 n=1 Tax=Trichinella spiralis TaxID=6334 RepID=UPI0001EFEA97|nr:frizzled-4 [Trichinella spiralis]